MHKITPTTWLIFEIVHRRAKQAMLSARNQAPQGAQADPRSPTPTRSASHIRARQRPVFLDRDFFESQYRTHRTIQYLYPRGGFPTWDKLYLHRTNWKKLDIQIKSMCLMMRVDLILHDRKKARQAAEAKAAHSVTKRR